MNRWLKFCLAVCLGLSWTKVQAQISKNLLMPPPVNMNMSGWDVTTQEGNLTFGLPIAAVPGEVPIRLSYGMNATYTSKATTHNVYDPVTRLRESVTDVIDRPMVGGVHFGYVSDQATYDGLTVDGVTVLEDGTQIADRDWTAFSANPTLGTVLNLPQAYGFAAVGTSTAMVDPTATYLTYTTTGSGLGTTYQSIVQGLAPSGFGALSSNYKVVLDKNRARIYAYATSVQAYVPIVWADRFNHYVTFQWLRSTTGLPSGITAITKVTAMNQHSQGLVLRWADYASNQISRDILRADFVGMHAPSVIVQGYPGYAYTPPSGIGYPFNATNEWTVVPSTIGATCRPLSIQIGPYGSLAKPSWDGSGSTAAAAPGAPPSDGTTDSLTRTWGFAYDTAQAELMSINQPNGLVSSFFYTNAPVVAVASFGSQIAFRGVSRVEMTDASGAKLNKRWTRTFATAGVPASAKVEGWWDPNQMANPDRYHQITFPADTLNSGNGVIQVDTLMDSSGKTWSTTTYGYNTTGAGVNASLSSVQSVTVQQDNAPTITTSLGYPNSLNLQATQQNVSSNSLWISKTTNTYAARWDMLEGHQLTNVATTRYASDGTTPLSTVTQANVFDPASSGVPLLQLQKSYLDGGTTGKHGVSYTYDTQGRPSTQQAYHVEGSTEVTAPNYLALGYDATTGAPSSQSLTNTLVSPNQYLNTTAGGFDSASRPTTSTDPSGVTTTSSYDDRGRKLSVSRPGSPAVSYGYPDELTATSTVNGLTTTTKFDGFGRISSVQKPTGFTSTGAVSYTTQVPTYDVYGRVVSVRETNPAGTVRNASTSYDSLDRITSQTPFAGGGSTTSYSVNGLNRIITTTLTNQVSSSKRIDPFGQVVEQIAPNGTITDAYFDGAGRTVEVDVSATDPGSDVRRVQTRTWSFDALGRLTSKTEPETNTQTFSGFNAFGQPSTVTEAAGTADARSRSLSYDGFGRLVSMTNGSDSVSNTYTGALLTSAIKTVGGVSVSQTFTYNAPGSVLDSETTTQPGFSSTIGYAYDSVTGFLTGLTYPSGRVVGYGYDALGRITSITNNGSSIVNNIKFDDWGNRDQIQFASGAQDQWTADLTGTKLNNWSIGYVGGGPDSRGYTYDDATNILKTAGEWKLTNDPNTGRLLEADGFGIKTAHTYDGFGNAISHLATPNGASVPSAFNNFTFNPMVNNQIPGVEANGALTGWNTNLRGEATQVGTATSSGTALGLAWDGLGLLKSVAWSSGGQAYLYAPSGMRVNVNDSSSGKTFNNTYTSSGLLLEQDVVWAAGSSNPNLWSGATSATVTVPTQWGEVARSIPCNPGDIISGESFARTVGLPPGSAILGIRFDSDTQTGIGWGSWTGMTHSANRVKLTTIGTAPAGATKAYLFLDVGPSNPGAQGIFDNVAYWKGSAGNPLRREVIYLGDQAIAEIDANGVHELHSDHLGTPRLVTKGAGTWASSQNGTVDGTQAFGPYGEMISQTGYAPLTGYTGHTQTDASGLIYMRGRYYSPAWHAFVNSDQGVDPSTWNQRAYLGGSPFMGTDPSGMKWMMNVLTSCTRIFDADGRVLWESCRSSILDIYNDGEEEGSGGEGQPQTPQVRHCEGLATIIGGNSNFIGRATGAFGNTITADSAAVIPSQFGFDSKDAMAPYASQISGQIWWPAGAGGMGPTGFGSLFSDVRDRADDAGTRKRKGWSLRQFENYQINKVSGLNGGNQALYIEIPGMSQINSAWVRITVPSSMPCPQGTTEKP
ncbi:hypothetical protein GETHLI_32500 [Geothrix limicola]|uniref:RHS repeat-associated core domain-containing protein n=1 Tax=Geothrix limicola TaxID=2927978 RepID=A0ABQ5QJL3_9BACT|nr:RHS repeat-associated core domain-containing protein [Geothrix limicola]GLH74748.1 hypothetical protein GETHLI_32500 [Geothrix limicola]